MRNRNHGGIRPYEYKTNRPTTLVEQVREFIHYRLFEPLDEIFLEEAKRVFGSNTEVINQKGTLVLVVEGVLERKITPGFIRSEHGKTDKTA